MAKNDGRPKAGDLVCHSVVDFMTIEADGCPENGDLVCHSVVGLSIEADRCPKAGDLGCHLVNLGSASGVPLRPEWSNNAVQPTGSWWPSLPRSSGGKLVA